MTWEIRVWHEELGDRVRLSIEAGPDVPNDVISTLAGSYWVEEVEYPEDDWDGETDESGGNRLQG